MGDPRKAKKKFERPRKTWDKKRIEEETKLKELYGLKNNREIWRAKSFLRNKRRIARTLLAKNLEERLKRAKEVLDNLMNLNLLREKAVLEDVFTLGVNDLLERRLQTIVWRQNLSNTVKQARQFIVHGHIAVNGKKVTIPGFIVPKEFESSISYYGKPLELEIKASKSKAVSSEEKDLAKKELEKEFEEVKEAAEKMEAEELSEKEGLNE